MTVAAGLTDSRSRTPASARDVCHFSDDRLSAAQKLAFVHELLRRDMAEVRMFLDHLERYAASLGDAERQSAPECRCASTRSRTTGRRATAISNSRATPIEPAVQRADDRSGARDLGWLTPGEAQAEFVRMIADRMARNAVGLRRGRPGVRRARRTGARAAR